MDPVELEQLIDRELKGLPTPAAPGTLLPRVMAAAAVRPRARRLGWTSWSRAWQAASIVLFVALAGGLYLALPLVRPALGGMTPSSVGAFAIARSAIQAVDDAVTLVRLFWRLLVEPIAFYLLVLAVSLSLACAGIWTALERTSWERASHQ